MAGAAFPRESRLLQPAEFRSVFDNPPLRFSVGEIVLLARPNGLDHSRLGLVAPKKACKLATGRNRFKRQVREYFRQHPHEELALDIIVMARGGMAKLDNTGIRQRLDTLWTRLLKRAAPPPRPSPSDSSSA